MWLQEIDPLTDKAYTDLILPPWPFWRACEAAGLPVMLLMLAVSEVSLPGALVYPFLQYAHAGRPLCHPTLEGELRHICWVLFAYCLHHILM